MTVIELTDLKTTINWLLENGEFEDKETSYNIAMNAVDMLEKQLTIPRVVKSLPTEQCVRDWYKEGDIDDNFWKHSTEWSNEDVFKEVYKALTYFINRWQ